MNKGAAARAAAASSLQQVLQYERSLSQALPEAVQHFKLSPGEKALAQAICFGVLRELPSLEWLASQLVEKPLKNKVRVVHYVLLTGIHQLRSMRTAKHAAVSATVETLPLLRQKALKGFANGVLRNYQRQQQSLENQLTTLPAKAHNHPEWLARRILEAYPSQAQAVMQANHAQPPMWLRVNARKSTALDYQQQLADLNIESIFDPTWPQALRLKEATDVTRLPGFAEGVVSVQDAAAQFAAGLIPVKAGERILDACAAPGGKTAHLLELHDVDLLALDANEKRLQRVDENLKRLQLKATTVCADASSCDWWDGEPFDHILLDAPCSGTGVIRRHPDIKWLRRNSDINELSALQSRIIENLWPMLKPGGTLLYATCSILPEENTLQIEHFLNRYQDATLANIQTSDSICKADENRFGVQWLPQIDGHDGFYYARLVKAI